MVRAHAWKRRQIAARGALVLECGRPMSFIAGDRAGAAVISWELYALAGERMSEGDAAVCVA